MSCSNGESGTPKKFRRRKTRTGQHYRVASAYRNFRPGDIELMPKRKLDRLWMKLAFPLTDGEPYCPKCGSTKYWNIKTRSQFQCGGCGHRYSKTSGTAFACRKLPIRKILHAIATFGFKERGCPAHSYAAEIGVSVKTAWVMFHKVRDLMKHARKDDKIEEDCAIDGALFGGYARPSNLEKYRKDRRKRPRSSKRQKSVVIIKGRNSNSTILAQVFEHEAHSYGWVKDAVPEDCAIYSDEGSWWTKLGLTHDLYTVNHGDGYKIDGVDTNTAESFFATFRAAAACYVSVSRNYFLDYVIEQVWRRTAKNYPSNKDRFLSIASQLSHVTNRFRGYWQTGLAA